MNGVFNQRRIIAIETVRSRHYRVIKHALTGYNIFQPDSGAEIDVTAQFQPRQERTVCWVLLVTLEGRVRV